MDFDEYEYLEKAVEEEPDTRKRDRGEKTRRKNESGDEDEIADSKSKRSKLEAHNGDNERDREKSSRRDRGDKDRHRSSRDVEKERGRDRERDRDREPRNRERDGEKRREKDKEREKERDKEKERVKEKEREREKEKEKEREREKSRRSSSRSRRHSSDPEKDVEREDRRPRSRDREARERERELELEIRERERESRRYKEKKEVAEPEADPERDQRTVFAYQMPLKATERDVYEFFSQAGKVRDVRLIMDRNSRRSKGVGYIEFYDAMSVPMAIALSGRQFLGQPVMVKPSEAEKNLVQSTAGASGALTGMYGAVARKLYVGNLHFNMTEEQLRQVFEPFGPVELVQLPLDLETGQCKGFGFVQFAQLEHAKAAQSLNGKLDIAGRVIKVSAVTDHPGIQNAGANAADFDDDDGGGLSLNAQSRAMLMQKLDRTGVATSIAGSLGVPTLNGSASNQQTISLPVNMQAGVPTPVLPALVPSAVEPIGTPSVCLLLKNMFDPATEMDPEYDIDIRDEVQEECSNFGPVKHIYVDKNSAGHVYLRFETVAAAAGTQRAMHQRWYARRLISAVFMQLHEYEAKFSNGA